MTRLLGALVLSLLLVGCGESSVQTYSKDGVTLEPRTSAPTADPAAAALKATCDKLLRQWAVAARGLNTAFYLAVPDGVQESQDGMGAATDSMEVEGCPDSTERSAALMGNYQAALADAHFTACRGDEMRCGERAGDEWKKNGEPLIEQVRAVVG